MSIKLPHENQPIKTFDFLPKPQVQASQFQVHISYFLQKCKKDKPCKMDLPFLKKRYHNN